MVRPHGRITSDFPPLALPAAWYFPVKRLWALLAVRRLKAARAQRLAALPRAERAERADELLSVFAPSEHQRRLEEPRLLLAEGVSTPVSLPRKGVSPYPFTYGRYDAFFSKNVGTRHYLSH